MADPSPAKVAADTIFLNSAEALQDGSINSLLLKLQNRVNEAVRKGNFNATIRTRCNREFEGQFRKIVSQIYQGCEVFSNFKCDGSLPANITVLVDWTPSAPLDMTKPCLDQVIRSHFVSNDIGKSSPDSDDGKIFHSCDTAELQRCLDKAFVQAAAETTEDVDSRFS